MNTMDQIQDALLEIFKLLQVRIIIISWDINNFTPALNIKYNLHYLIIILSAIHYLS